MTMKSEKQQKTDAGEIMVNEGHKWTEKKEMVNSTPHMYGCMMKNEKQEKTGQ